MTFNGNLTNKCLDSDPLNRGKLLIHKPSKLPYESVKFENPYVLSSSMLTNNSNVLLWEHRLCTDFDFVEDQGLNVQPHRLHTD